MPSDTRPFGLVRALGRTTSPPSARQAAKRPEAAALKMPARTPADEAFNLIFAPGAGERALRDAGKLLLQAYGARLKQKCQSRWRRPEADAEEVVLDTVHRFITQVQPNCDCPEALLHAIFARLLIDLYRRDQALGRIPADLLDAVGCPGDDNPAAQLRAQGHSSDPVQILAQRELTRLVYAVMQTSAGRRLQVLHLLADGYTPAEIAQRLGISGNAARDQIHRIRVLLRATLKDAFQ